MYWEIWNHDVIVNIRPGRFNSYPTHSKSSKGNVLRAVYHSLCSTPGGGGNHPTWDWSMSSLYVFKDITLWNVFKALSKIARQVQWLCKLSLTRCLTYFSVTLKYTEDSSLILSTKWMLQLLECYIDTISHKKKVFPVCMFSFVYAIHTLNIQKSYLC